MSNRQARREQSRTTRGTRTPQRPAGRPSSGPPRRTGGGSSFGGGNPLFSGFGLLAIGVVVLLAAALAGILIFSGGDSDSAKAADSLEKFATEFPADLASGNKLGQDSAPIKLTMFEDFQCPFCLEYTSSSEPQLVEEYVKTGKVQLQYEHFPGLGFESVLAANAAQCAADQNKFWQYHNLLFLTQAKAGQIDNEKVNVDRFSADNLKKFGSEVGVDRTAFDACIDNDTHATLVQDQQRRARSLGITGTPGFLINGTPIGSGAPATMEDWRRVLDNALEQAANAANSPTPSASANPAASPSASATGSPTASASPTATRTP